MNFHKRFKLRLKDFVYLVPEQTRIQVRWDEHAVVLTNESAVELVKNMAPLLDGTCTVDDLFSQLPAWDKEDILNVLEFFDSYGLLEDASLVSPFSPEQETQWKDQLLYFSLFSDNKYRLQDKLAGTRVLVLGEGILLREMLLTLEKAGMQVIEPGPHVLEPSHKPHNPESKKEVEAVIAETDADIIIVATSKLFSPLFSWVNTVSLYHKRPWTSCTIYGEKGMAGPTVIPGQTPCYTCLSLRRSSNLVHIDEFLTFETFVRENIHLQKSSGSLTGAASIVTSICVLELIKLITGIGPVKSAGAQISFNPLTMEMKVHPILKLPRCPDCGLPSKETRTERVWMK
jgi:bacteriocin biosynthesis cyclodehydratase domain-containing protein